MAALDQTGQDLSVLKLRLVDIHHALLILAPDKADKCLEAESFIDKIIEDVRRLSHGLSPAAPSTSWARTAAQGEIPQHLGGKTVLRARTRVAGLAVGQGILAGAPRRDLKHKVRQVVAAQRSMMRALEGSERMRKPLPFLGEPVRHFALPDKRFRPGRPFRPIAVL